LVVDARGEECVCGNTGCLETVASESAILRYIARRQRSVGPASFVAAVELARSGDKVAIEAFRRAGDALGLGIAAVMNLVNPQKILLSGEGLIAEDLLVEAVNNSIAEHAFSTAAADCQIISTPHGAETWARGAAALVLNTLISRSGRLTGMAALTSRS
jgi:predicted NBD/HSP70 family sugar kinase